MAPDFATGSRATCPRHQPPRTRVQPPQRHTAQPRPLRAVQRPPRAPLWRMPKQALPRCRSGLWRMWRHDTPEYGKRGSRHYWERLAGKSPQAASPTSFPPSQRTAMS